METLQCNLSDSGASIDSGSSITETQQQQKMPDLSETKLVQRKNNSMSAVVVPVSTGSSGDEFPHEDIEDKPLDSVDEEVRTISFLRLWKLKQILLEIAFVIFQVDKSVNSAENILLMPKKVH